MRKSPTADDIPGQVSQAVLLLTPGWLALTRKVDLRMEELPRWSAMLLAMGHWFRACSLLVLWASFRWCKEDDRRET